MTNPRGQSAININLCAGAGGLALGLVQAGFAVSAFYDKDRNACETLHRNVGHPLSTLKGRVWEGDLSQVDWMPSGPQVRLLAAGAPCQPFSRGGAHRGHEDRRNLFPTIMKAVRILRPRAVLIENVRGLDRGSHRPYLNYVLRQLSNPDLGPGRDEPWEDHDRRLQQYTSDQHTCSTYRVVWAVLNAADYGVPQIRHRLFIVATAIDLPVYSFPLPTHSSRQLRLEQATRHYWEDRKLKVPSEGSRTPPLLAERETRLPWLTVRDAIQDLPTPASVDSDNCNNHWTIPGARAYAGHTGSVLDWPSKTLKAGVHGVPGGENMVVCDDGSVRYYTLREMARIQSFPDSHYFTGARSNVTRQIGNAVPCGLASGVAGSLLRLFD